MKSRRIGPKSATREEWCENRVLRVLSQHRLVVGSDFEFYREAPRGFRWCVESFFELAGRPLVCFGRSDFDWTVLTTDFMYGSIRGVPRSFDLTAPFDLSLKQSDNYKLNTPKGRYDRLVLKRELEAVEFWTPRGSTCFGFVSAVGLYPFEKTHKESKSISG